MDGFGNREVFADNLQYYMDATGRTRSDVCAAIDVPYTTFTNWVNANSYPRIDALERLARYFGISKSDLTEKKARGTMTINNLTEKQKTVINLISKLSADQMDQLAPLLEQAIQLVRK